MPFWTKKEKTPQTPSDIQALIERRAQNCIIKSNTELIVDDNQVNRDVLCRYLKKYGYETTQAINGFNALEKLAETDYHIVWIDLKMPIMDGLEAVRYLRAPYPSGFGYKGFIVGVTGYADTDTRDMCLKTGMNVVITKPYAGDHINRLHNHPFFLDFSLN